MEKRENIPYIDSLRTVAILGVILIHTSSRVLEITHYDLKTYFTSLYLNQFARFAVPLFFIISGFVLELNYKEKLNTISFIKKRFSKIFIPYVFWSLIYYLFVYTNNTDNFLRVLLVGNASYQLYFIPTICIFYLFYPLIHRYYKVFLNLPVVLMLTFYQIHLMNEDYYIKQFSLPDPIRTLVLGFIFFIFGILASRNKELILKIVNKIKLILPIVFILFSHKLYINSMEKYYKTFNINAFYSQWRIEVLFYTLISTLFFISFLNRQNIISTTLKGLSKYSYLVFFIHVIFIEIIWRYGGPELLDALPAAPQYLIPYDIIFFLSVSALSFGFSHLIHLIPNAKRITG